MNLRPANNVRGAAQQHGPQHLRPLNDLGDLPRIQVIATSLELDVVRARRDAIVLESAQWRRVGALVFAHHGDNRGGRVYLEVRVNTAIPLGYNHLGDGRQVDFGSAGFDARSTRKQKNDHHFGTVALFWNFVPGSSPELSRKSSCRPISSRSALGHRQIGTEQGRLGGRAFLSFSCVPVNPNVKGDYMPHSRIVPPLLAALKQMGIPQREVAQILGCSSSLISLVSAGERSLTIPDLEGLLKRLAALYPQHRAELAEAALGPLLADLGCEVRVLSGPPPAAPAGKVVILSEWRSQRELRRAA